MKHVKKTTSSSEERCFIGDRGLRAKDGFVTCTGHVSAV